MTVSSVERPVSALRQRMLEDMAMRGLRSDTQRDYVRFVRRRIPRLQRIFVGFRFTSARAGCSRHHQLLRVGVAPR
jgi:hypothetical protein